MVRPNSAIVVGDNELRPDYTYRDGFTLQVYQLADGREAVAQIPSPAGETEVTFTVKRVGETVTVQWQGTPANWRLLLVGVESIGAVAGGAATRTAAGTQVTPAATACVANDPDRPLTHYGSMVNSASNAASSGSA